MSYHIELFHSLLNDFLQGEAALLTLDGDVLAVRGSESISYGTLVTAATTVCKYLPMKEGDIVLLNDPYSGGSRLCEMTLVMAVSEDLLWVTCHRLQPRLKIAKSIEEEGLRIPPTPVRQNNQLNEVILSAIQAHPACPPHFIAWLKQKCEELTLAAQKLHSALENTGFTITAELIAEYLELSKQTAQQKISERASGEARVDVVLDSGELLRLNMDIQDGKVALDFSGTSSAKTLSLTEAATYGVCFHALSRFYGFDHLANSGTFSVLQITKPVGCWLIGKYPAPIQKGMTCGVAALKTALDLAFTQIHKKEEQALSCHCSLQVDMEFGNQHICFDVPGGTGASSQREGSSAHLPSFSIEELESKLPVKVLRVDRRHSSGGKGKFSGGRGVVLKLQAQEDFTATWLTDLTLHRPRLPKTLSHGDACEVSYEHAGQRQELPVLGQRKLLKGDIITLCSGSGGGYGKES